MRENPYYQRALEIQDEIVSNRRKVHGFAELGFDLPQTGDRGVWMYGLIGVVLMAGSLTSLYLANRKKQGK